MAYTQKVEGMEELVELLQKAGDAAQGIASKALYKGAGVAADAITKSARGLKTSPFKYAAGGQQRDLSPEEKEAIVSAGAAGIAKFQKTGNEVNTSVGFNRSGYASVKGKSKPVAVIVNSVNHGTSFMKKQPFIRKAVNQSKASEIIGEVIQEEVEKLLK